MSPAAEGVIRRLDAARQKWWFFSLLTTCVLALCASFGTFMVFMLADSFLTFSQLTLLLLLLVWLGASLWVLYGVGRRMLHGQRSIEAAARRVEEEFPELNSNLINVVQLSEDKKNVDRTFCDAAINHAAGQIGYIPFDQAPEKETRWRRFLDCMQTPRDLVESFSILVALIVLAVVCELLIPNWSSAASRLMAPWEFVPSVGSVEIVRVTPGNSDVLVGQSVEIIAEIKNPENTAYHAVMYITPKDEPETELILSADEKHQFYKITVPTVLKPFKYRLEIGDSQSEKYAIDVREKPVVDSVEVVFHYPAYLGRKSETMAQKGMDLDAPQYTVAELRMRTSSPVAKGYLESEGTRYVGKVEQDGNLIIASIPLLKNGSYFAKLFNEAGHTDPNPRMNRITVVPDKAPTVELLKPARQSSASPGTVVPVMVRAGDDHGIDHVQLEMKIKAAESDEKDKDKAPADAGPATIVKQWNDFTGDSTTTAVCHHSLELKANAVKPGQTVMVRAVVWDKRVVNDWSLDLRPQETASGWYTVKIVAEDTKASAALEQIENLRGNIWKILEKQIHARATAAEVLKKEKMDERTGLTSAIRTQQVEIQKGSSDIVKSIGDTHQEERQSIKRILNNLAFGDMLKAITVSEAMAKLKAPGDFAKPVPELTASQDRIINVLRKLLDVTRQAQTEALSEMKKRPGGDLPDDTKKKLEDMHAKLDKFLEQQKKVIEATENLAKKPQEDFSKEEEEALKGMAATEDDWSKFMKEMKSDFSKLPEQDFANSSMAKELSEIQTQLKMAEDALLAKSADIAVPLEQLGAEMAEEMKVNLEKWLPDTPDREKWSQEETLSDKDKETPMAELPGELEDMMGDLMEEEEDLFDEMEDVSSSGADSPDKGVGWDAVDGPISTFTAKGITGNRLPNTSEIGGRSGEGRQGKSNGEFVGDEAVGKGGRKTPSRLSPDPVVKGQIKDHSKQSAGGATGGGKESGKGGEGLEGPTGRSPGPREATRLAEKQAALRNKAESVQVQFQVTNFHHTDLKKLIDTMSQIERDLKAGRYQNALRQKQQLAGDMKNVKQYLEGEFQTRQDTTTNLPTDIQKEILGSMQDPSPSGWEDLNRDYFERLSGSGEAGTTGADKDKEKGKEKDKK